MTLQSAPPWTAKDCKDGIFGLTCKTSAKTAKPPLSRTAKTTAKTAKTRTLQKPGGYLLPPGFAVHPPKQDQQQGRTLRVIRLIHAFHAICEDDAYARVWGVLSGVRSDHGAEHVAALEGVTGPDSGLLGISAGITAHLVAGLSGLDKPGCAPDAGDRESPLWLDGDAP